MLCYVKDKIMTVKDQVLKAMEDLPQNASIEDAMDKLYLLYKINRGIEQANNGQKISHGEAKKRMKKWLS